MAREVSIMAHGSIVLFGLIAGCGRARSEQAAPACAPLPAAPAGVAPAPQPAIPLVPIRLNVADIPWGDAPPGLPAGAKTAVLEGDPRKSGFFTMRLRLPAGARLNPHVHPIDERVTILSGSIHVAFGDKFDPTQGKTFTAGAFYVTPTPTPHFVWTDEECILQVTGTGPWGLTYVGQPR